MSGHTSLGRSTHPGGAFFASQDKFSCEAKRGYKLQVYWSNTASHSRLCILPDNCLCLFRIYQIMQQLGKLFLNGIIAELAGSHCFVTAAPVFEHQASYINVGSAV